MSSVSTPRSAARSRSTSMRSSGLSSLQGDVGIEQAQFRRLLAQPFGVGEERVEIRAQQGEVDVEIRAAADEGLGIADADPHIGHAAEPAADLLLDVALAEVVLEARARAASGAGGTSGRCARHAGSSRTKKRALFMPPRKPLPAACRGPTGRPGVSCSSRSTRSAALGPWRTRPAPSPAVTLTSNSPSSTLLGRIFLAHPVGRAARRRSRPASRAPPPSRAPAAWRCPAGAP